MIISLIVAMDESHGIGLKGGIPWYLSDDLKRFKQVTMDHHLIMGRVTYESIGHALPGRVTIVITRQVGYLAPGCLLADSLISALELAESRGESEAFIIGGGEIFAQSLELADRLYLTRVHTRLDCDVTFPPIRMDEWEEVERASHPADERNQFPFTFQLLQRRKDQVA